MRKVRVNKSASIRGITFFSNGQQYSGQLESSDYLVIGDCITRYSDMGAVKESPAVKLQNIRTGEHWYVAPAVAAELPDAPEDTPLSAEQIAIVDSFISDVQRANHGRASVVLMENRAWTEFVNRTALQNAFPQLRNKKGLPVKSDNPAKRFALAVAERFIATKP